MWEEAGVATFGINYHTHTSTAAAAAAHCWYTNYYIGSDTNCVQVGATWQFSVSFCLRDGDWTEETTATAKR